MFDAMHRFTNPLYLVRNGLKVLSEGIIAWFFAGSLDNPGYIAYGVGDRI